MDALATDVQGIGVCGQRLQLAVTAAKTWHSGCRDAAAATAATAAAAETAFTAATADTIVGTDSTAAGTMSN